jgi:TrmH family RNA methyltransferase
MISKSQISYIKSLHQKKFRKEYRQFIIEGEKLCDEFINSNFNVRQIYLLDSKRVKYEDLLLKISKKIEIIEVKPDDLDRMSTMSTAPDVLMLVEMPEDPSIHHANINYSSDLTLVLDGVKDPGNFGTIIRIADWYGIKNIVCSADCVELYNPKVVQSTMGSILRTRIYYTDIENYLADLNEVNIYGAQLSGENIYSLDGKLKGLLLMGSESHGISASLLTYITHPITIPSWGEAESLNVAVATGILCSEARRRDI